MPRTRAAGGDGASADGALAPLTAALAGSRKRAVFRLFAPHAREVELCGNFNDWERARNPLKKDPAGVWKTQLLLTPGTYEYRYVVDGEWWDDPEAADRVPNGFGTQNCLRTV
jgi:1,4-alpha-glucan branching enzyme